MTDTGAPDRGYTSVHRPDAGLTVGQLATVVEEATPVSTVEVVLSLDDGESRPVSRVDVASDGLRIRVAEGRTDTRFPLTVQRLLAGLTKAEADDPVWLVSASGEFRVRLKAAMASDDGTGLGVYLYVDEIK